MYAWCAQINYDVTGYSGDPLGVSGDPQANSNLGYGVTLLWNKVILPPNPTGNLTYELGPVNYNTGVFCVWCKELRQWHRYSLATGDLLWGPTASQDIWDMYGASVGCAYGNLYSCGYGGVLYSYNMTTGNLEWNYTANNVGYESPYGNYDLGFGGVTFANGCVYVGTGEHSPTKPLYRGSDIRCINATTGAEIWKIQDYYESLCVADGYLISGNLYDNMVYCYGKGPSATTVSAPLNGITQGSSFTITGTVTDQSPGALGVNSLSTKGTPCVSDASMEQWMEYLYMQQPMPTNATGVPVAISVIDPNGNYANLGTVTNNLDGVYGLTVNTNKLLAWPRHVRSHRLLRRI